MKPDVLIEASIDLLTDLQDEPSKYGNQAPECISQLLALIDSLQADIQSKMTCIDEQARQLIDKDEAIRDLAIGLSAKRDVIEKQYKQIKKLQAALVDDRAELILAYHTGKEIACIAGPEDLAEAKRRLRVELPEEMA